MLNLRCNSPPQLENIGNACFVNSVFQALGVTGPVHDLPTGVHSPGTVMGCMGDLLRGGNLTRSASSLRNVVAKKANREPLNNGTQQDAMEFLECLLWCLKEENEQWFKKVFDGQESFNYNFATTRDGSCEECGAPPIKKYQAFSQLALGNNEPGTGITDLSNHIKSRERYTHGALKCSECCERTHPRSNPCRCKQKSMVSSWKIHKYPEILVIMVGHGSPQIIEKENNRGLLRNSENRTKIVRIYFFSLF